MDPKHTTNYFNTLILVSEDCPAVSGETPPASVFPGTIAENQYSIIRHHPYAFTSDEVIFQVHAIRKGIPEEAWPQARMELFSKGQACLRSSPLSRRYGWGIHSNAEGRIAMVAVESDDYRRLEQDPAVKKVRAMRSHRAGK